ncbi:hypothetical protein LPJ73_005965, partial [Coemansia sp. RSA 2703]
MLKTRISQDDRVLANDVPVFAQNYSCTAGTVYLIDGLLTIPPTIEELLQQQYQKHQQQHDLSNDGYSVRAPTPSDGSEFSSIERLIKAAGWSHVLDMRGDDKDAKRMHTLWAFNNQAFAADFNYAERFYLMYGPEFTKDDDELYKETIEDTRRFVAGHITPGSISIARLGKGEHKVPRFDDGPEMIVVVEEGADGGGLSARIDGQQIGTSDIVARNGIVHGLDKVDRPDDLLFTPQKALIGLNATMFVRLLKDTGLGDYIDGTKPDRKLTLLVPTNRAMEDAFGYDLDDGDDENLAYNTSADNRDEYNKGTLSPLYAESERFLKRSPRERQREWAQYHIADGMHGIDELAAHPLLRTKLASEWTDNKAQVVKAQVDKAYSGTSSHVSFNGADNILNEPLVIGNTVIYLLSSPMATPPNMINALIQNLDLSLFVAAM